MSTATEGLELDTLVATKVMGWMLWENYLTGDWEGPDDAIAFAPWSDGVAVYLPEDDGEESFRFSPSMYIADAWRVVDKLSGFDDSRAERWLSVAVYNAQKGQVGCKVYACHPGQSIFDTDGRHVISEVVGNSAPHAICLAALKASEAAVRPSETPSPETET